ncbi:MAG: hypothetical protein ACMXYK_03600 [Candidatus Woesearchaeota archaeon]
MSEKILNAKEKKQFYAKLEEYFGITEKIDCALSVNLKNKYFLVSNDLSKTYGEIFTKVMGLYVGEINQYGELRLSIEGSQIFGPYATKQVLELSEEDAFAFMQGKDLEITQDLPQKYHILYYVSDGVKHYVGCAKYKEGMLLNFTPKSRRIATNN